MSAPSGYSPIGTDPESTYSLTNVRCGFVVQSGYSAQSIDVVTSPLCDLTPEVEAVINRLQQPVSVFFYRIITHRFASSSQTAFSFI